MSGPLPVLRPPSEQALARRSALRPRPARRRAGLPACGAPALAGPVSCPREPERARPLQAGTAPVQPHPTARRERDRNAECRRVARRQRHDASAVICPQVVARIAVPPPAAVPERRTVAGPHRAHHQMEAAALDPGVPSRGARTGCGRVDPGNAHAAATEVEAVHMPAAATAWIGRRAGGVDFALVAAVDFVGAIFGGPHLHPLSVELAVERHVDALGRVRGPARGERENDQRQSPRRRRENAHVAPVARLAIHPRKEGRKRLTSLWHSPADGNRI